MVFVPKGNLLVEYLAEPPVRLTEAKTVEPIKKRTLPVGVPNCADTVAMKVTDLPKIEGFTDETRVTVVGPLVTVCETVFEVLALKVASPLYAAVVECVPILRLPVMKAALLLLTGTLPRMVAPSEKVIVPDA